MFAPLGWISLKDVYEYFVWYFSEHDSIGSFNFTGDECYELTWYFANEAKEIGVCGINGVIIPASRGLVETNDEFSHENFHVNLHFGTVGSGEILQSETFPGGLENANQYADVVYGPFRNLPLIFKSDDFDKYLQRLAEDEREDDQPSVKLDNSPRAVSQRILDAWRDDRSLVQGHLRAMVAPQMSVRAFRLAWGLAVMHEPELRKPGRRKGKS